MASEEIHTWNLVGLIGAFIDLFVAYVLLCVSTIAFLAFNLYRFFGLHLPCPCKGILGFKNSNLCFHMMLYEWPLKKVCSIQVMAAKRFPFDLVWVKKDHSLNYAHENKMVVVNDNRVVELEDESSCSGPPRLLSIVDNESGYDAKGKRVMSLKRRSGIRRRKRGGYDCGKIDSVICCDDFHSDVVAFTSCSQSINVASGKEVSLHYDEDDRTFHDLDEKPCHSYEFNASMVDSPVRGIYSSSMEHYMSTTVQDNIQIVKNEDDRIKMLENALEEERSAYAALYLELEKERAAAASAADEAMAMILRLQEEKASMEMEMRQFERLIEERAAYDEEEMNIMQEILIRREKENLFLEKELESCRGQRPPLSFETFDDPPQIESTISNVKKDGEEREEKTEHKDQVCDYLHSSYYDTESDVLDVHVIDDNVERKEKEIENFSSSLCSTLSDIPTNTHVEFGNYPCASKTENINNVDGLNRQLSMLYISKHKSLPLDCESDSSCSVHNVEKLRIDNEIEVLGERLRIVKHEKEKLTLFAEKGENEKGQLKLLEEIANRLQQIKQLRNPARGASLPPSSTKVSDRKRRCQSATWETCESY